MKYHIAFDLELKRNRDRGFYIVLEGVDGSGKTTQAAALASHIRSLGKKVVHTREPRKEGLIGDIIQEVLTGALKLSPSALQYLFSTDRVLNHDEVVVPALKRGDVVVSDRCFWSAVVYGILDRTQRTYDMHDIDLLLITQSILSMYHQFTVPDVTIYLHVSLKTALERIRLKDDKKEIYEDHNKLRRIISGYEYLLARFPKEISRVNGEGSIPLVTQRILEAMQKSK